MSGNFTDYRKHVGSRSDRHFKATLFESPRLLLGLNCLEAGQEQPIHDHVDQDKFYYVIEGLGEFTVGSVVEVVGEGGVIWAPAGLAHGVRNPGSGRLVVLMGLAPWK